MRDLQHGKQSSCRAQVVRPRGGDSSWRHTKPRLRPGLQSCRSRQYRGGPPIAHFARPGFFGATEIVLALLVLLVVLYAGGVL